MWLHMGSFGPMKVDAATPETIAGPPFRYGANPDTLLDISDLVFIDAPTTGLSREVGKGEPKDFFGVDKDLDAFTRTIQRYLTKYQRWNSPKFIIGESYGTTRAAGLSNSLLDAGVQLNGITFVSAVFNFAGFQGGQSLIGFLPTSAADILRSNLRVQPDRFRRELLRERHEIIGRIDSRYVGTEPDNVGEGTDNDTQGSAIT